MDASTAALARRGGWTKAGFALALAVVVAIATVTLWTFQQHKAATLLVTRTEQVRTALSEARWALADLRASELSSYLGSRSPRPSAAEVAALRMRLDEARRLTGDNPTQQERLADFDRALTALVEHLQAQAASPVPGSGGDTAAAAARTDEMLRGLNARFVELDRVEKDLLASRQSLSDARMQNLAWAIAALVAVLAVLLPVMYVQIRRWQKQEDRLLVAEQRFHLMAQNVAEYAITMLDAKGYVRTWNVGAQRLKGYATDEIVGQHFSRFYLPEEVAGHRPQYALQQAAAEGRYEDEGWRMRKDGSRFWASVVLTALRDPAGEVSAFLKITRDLTERRQAEEALRAEVAETHRVERKLQELNHSLEAEVAKRTAELTAANARLEDARERLQELSTHLIESQEDERRRISHELHDETGQALTAIKLRLSAGLRDGALEAKGIESCMAMVDDTIYQIRRLVLDLRPLVLDDLGLADAVEAMLQRVAERTGWTTELRIDVLPRTLPPAIETASFRIVQEAVTNAARHAGARAVEVGLKQDGDRLVATIRDDGRGFDLASMRTPQMRRAHFGLVSMSERATLAGGSIAIESSPGNGTTVRVTLPLPPQTVAQEADVA
jgi:PAS domain S-box-containing protein